MIVRRLISGTYRSHVWKACVQFSTTQKPQSLELKLQVTDTETINALNKYQTEEERTAYALSALKIGVTALTHAGVQIDASRIRNEGEALIKQLNLDLAVHSTQTIQQIEERLKEYFHPSSGRFNERVDRLLRKNGELETLLDTIIGPESDLSRRLNSLLGKDSEIVKMFSMKEETGALQLVRSVVEDELLRQRNVLLSEFSLDNKESALNRLVLEVKKSQNVLEDNMDNKINKIVQQFSLDQNDSALSRMMKQLMTALTENAKENRDFQEQVKLRLSAMETAKEMIATQSKTASLARGAAFEEALYMYLSQCSLNSGDLCEATGHTTGLIKSCKVGDIVITLGPESIAANARIVIEAKDHGGISFVKAVEEMEIARKNRDAEVGIYVFSADQKIPIGFPDDSMFHRYGNDIYVIWDKSGSNEHIYLKAALSIARALSIKKGTINDHDKNKNMLSDKDIQNMMKSILEIEKKMNGLSEVTKWTQTIKSSSEKILKKVNVMSNSIDDEIMKLNGFAQKVRDFASKTQQYE